MVYHFTTTHCGFVALFFYACRGIMFSGRPYVRPCHFREHDISGTAWRNFFKFGINVQLDSRMDRLHYGGQMSRSLWPEITHFWPKLKNSCTNYDYISHKCGLSSFFARRVRSCRTLLSPKLGDIFGCCSSLKLAANCSSHWWVAH